MNAASGQLNCLGGSGCGQLAIVEGMIYIDYTSAPKYGPTIVLGESSYMPLK